MSEFKTIPSHPKYQIDRHGAVRIASNGTPISPFMGRASIEEEKHWRVRLRNEMDYPVAHSIEDLMEETFDDYQRPHKPLEVVKPVKREKKWVADRNSQVRKEAENRAPKDPSVEWRVIPGFSKYEINSKGDVWSAHSNRLITRKHPKDRLPSYHLYTDGMRKTNRAVQSLIDLAFPELITPKPIRSPKGDRAVRRNRGKDSWKDIPGFDRYQISKDGALRYKSNKQILPTINNGEVRLTTTFSVQELMDRTFNQKEAA